MNGMVNSPDALGDDPCTVTGIRAIDEPGEGLVELEITVGRSRTSLWKDSPPEHPWYGHFLHQVRRVWNQGQMEAAFRNLAGGCPSSALDRRYVGRTWVTQSYGRVIAPGTCWFERSSQTAPATAPRMITAPIAMNQVMIAKIAPIVPYVLLSEMIVDEK